jgi:hypothetical protein
MRPSLSKVGFRYFSISLLPARKTSLVLSFLQLGSRSSYTRTFYFHGQILDLGGEASTNFQPGSSTIGFAVSNKDL